MEYISASQFAQKYGISERTARNYCAKGKIEGAFPHRKDMEHSRRGRFAQTRQKEGVSLALRFARSKREWDEGWYLPSGSNRLDVQFQSY